MREWLIDALLIGLRDWSVANALLVLLQSLAGLIG